MRDDKCDMSLPESLITRFCITCLILLESLLIQTIVLLSAKYTGNNKHLNTMLHNFLGVEVRIVRMQQVAEYKSFWYMGIGFDFNGHGP